MKQGLSNLDTIEGVWDTDENVEMSLLSETRTVGRVTRRRYIEKDPSILRVNIITEESH